MKDLDLVVSIRQSLALGSRIHPKHAGGTYQEARPIPVRMDLRSTAPAERGGRGEASPREETWPSLACSSCPLGTGGDGPRRKLPGGKRAGEGIGGETGRADEGGAAGGARAGRLRSYQDEGKWLLPLFFRGVRACPFFFQVISAGRGGAAADAVVGAARAAGGPIGRHWQRQDQPGFGRGRRAASAVRCPCPGAGREKQKRVAGGGGRWALRATKSRKGRVKSRAGVECGDAESRAHARQGSQKRQPDSAQKESRWEAFRFTFPASRALEFGWSDWSLNLSLSRANKTCQITNGETPNSLLIQKKIDAEPEYRERKKANYNNHLTTFASGQYIYIIHNNPSHHAQGKKRRIA